MTNDATQLIIPLSTALVAGGGVITTLMGIVAWVFANFERKADATARYEALEERVGTHEATLQKVASDVAYIRGRLEPR